MIEKPLFFERNRVRRVYTGGKLLGKIWNEESTDGFFPEEWIASSVKAINKEIISEKDGISKIEGSNIYFDELLQNYPEEICGSRKQMRILVKILDSAIRLPAQAHPDQAFSKKYFHSEYGKTESWLILETRPEAKLYFGFKEGVNEKSFSEAIDESVENVNVMEDLMCYRVPSKNEVYFVPAKTVHAIGAGCLILEIQEPTDFTIQPEHWCGDYKLDEQEMYLGLSKEKAIECFDFKKAPDTKMIPKIIFEEKNVIVENLIGKNVTECFVINRIRLNDGKIILNIPNSYGVYIVTEGEGVLKSDAYERKIKKGDYFLMPCCLMSKYYIEGKLEIIECW